MKTLQGKNISEKIDLLLERVYKLGINKESSDNIVRYSMLLNNLIETEIEIKIKDQQLTNLWNITINSNTDVGSIRTRPEDLKTEQPELKESRIEYLESPSWNLDDNLKEKFVELDDYQPKA